MNNMRDLYNFIDEAYDVIDKYFEFFYGKRIFDFKGKHIEDEDAYREFIGESNGIKGKESDFENVFCDLIQKSKCLEIDSSDYIHIVEQTMLQTDIAGRIAIARRLVRKLGELARIGVCGIDEVAGRDFYYNSDYCLETIYEEELEVKDNMYKVPDNLIKTRECIEFIFSIGNKCCFFMDGFKELCRDFEIDYQKEIEAFGFEELERITSIEWYSKRKENSEGKRCTKKNEFTMQRKRTALLYMLKELSGGLIYGSYGDIPSTEVQRFVYFLTGNGTRTDDINNTSVATAFKKDNRCAATIKGDNEFVAEYFERVGLNKLAQKVRNE